MGWSCTRHEWDEGSEGWREATQRTLARVEEQHTKEEVLQTMVRLMTRIINKEDHDQEQSRERINELHAILEGRKRGPISTALATWNDEEQWAVEPLRRTIVANLEQARLHEVAARWAERLATVHRAALGIEDDDPAVESVRWAIAARIDDCAPGRRPVAYAPAGETAVEAIVNLACSEDAGRDEQHDVIRTTFEIAHREGSPVRVLQALAEATGSKSGHREPIRKIWICIDVTHAHRLVASIDPAVLEHHGSLAHALRAIAREAEPPIDEDDEQHEARIRAVNAARDELCHKFLADEVDQAALALAQSVRWDEDQDRYRQQGLIATDDDGRGIEERIRHHLGPGKHPVERIVGQAREIVLEQVRRWLVGDQEGALALATTMDGVD